MAWSAAWPAHSQPGDRVVITEDTTTRGTTLLEAVEVVREYGCRTRAGHA